MILVTGATGLLGSHITAQFVRKGEYVRAVYREENRKSHVYDLLKLLYPNSFEEDFARIEWFKGDILDLIDVADMCNGCSTIVHCAALVSFRKKDFSALFAVNRIGTANLVNQAIENNTEHFIYISSTAAVGSDTNYHDGLRRESNHWNANEKVSGYSLSKYSGEKEVWRGIEEGLKAVIVNPSVMFGAGNWDESSLTIFRTIKDGLTFYTRGGNAFVSVKDVARAVLILSEAKKCNERYLLTGTNTSFKQLFDLMSEALKVKAPSRLASPFLSGLAWRLSALISLFTGKNPTLTKESARSAQRTTRYTSEKFLNEFPAFQFTTLADTINETVAGKLN